MLAYEVSVAGNEAFICFKDAMVNASEIRSIILENRERRIARVQYKDVDLPSTHHQFLGDPKSPQETA